MTFFPKEATDKITINHFLPVGFLTGTFIKVRGVCLEWIYTPKSLSNRRDGHPKEIL
jgi:hypothetical protein